MTPDAPAGQIVTGNNQLSTPLQVQIGQIPAQVTYQGLAPGFIGLYRFDIVVPPMPDNTLASFTFTLGGRSGSQPLYTAVNQ